MKQQIRKAAAIISAIIVPSLFLWACSNLSAPRPSLSQAVEGSEHAGAASSDYPADWTDTSAFDDGGATGDGSVDVDGSPGASGEYADGVDPGDISVDYSLDDTSWSEPERLGEDSGTAGGTISATYAGDGVADGGQVTTTAPPASPPAKSTPSPRPTPSPTRTPAPASTPAPSTPAPPTTDAPAKTFVAATARQFSLSTGCGSMFVATPNSDGFRNLTWLTSGNRQMDILGLGWDSAEALGVLVRTDAFWFSVSCAGKVSTAAPETYAVTSCGTLKIVAGSGTGTRRVSWVADRQPGAGFSLDDQALMSSTSAEIRSNGDKFPLRVECASTQTIIVS